MSPPGLFITGTDTEVGKTYVAAMIARWLAMNGYRVGVYKPAASGCRKLGSELVSDDAVALWEAAGRPATLDEVCPQRFEAAVAPPRAAEAAGSRVDEEGLVDGIDVWRRRSDIVIVEGVGGLLSPLADTMTVAALANRLGYPLVVVTQNTLGTINHTLATLVAARQCCRRSAVAGAVFNDGESEADDASRSTNLADLKLRLDVPLLATVSHGANQFEPVVDWFALATRFSYQSGS